MGWINHNTAIHAFELSRLRPPGGGGGGGGESGGVGLLGGTWVNFC